MDSLLMYDFLTKYQNRGFFRTEGIRHFNCLDLMKKDPGYEKTMSFLIEEYNKGYGFKSLIKIHNLPVSYTKLKMLFDISGVKRRHGRDVVTNKLRESRKTKAEYERDNKIGFFAPDVQEKLKIKSTVSRGIQGYYFNRSRNKYVWLRSSWEYVYAKWLDSNELDWDTEVNAFELKNGKRYRPDFFIYENNELVRIVEIKGYWIDKVWKYDELSKTLDIDLVLVTDIKPYVTKNSTLRKEFEFWKKNRILEHEAN